MPARKVLLLVNSLRTGGTERNVASICQHIDRNRFEPEVWVLKSGGEWEPKVKAAGVTIRSLNRGWARSPRFALRAARAIARTDAELVHAFLPTIGFYAALARSVFRLKKPMILSVGYTQVGWAERRMWRWFKRCYSRAVANSASVKTMLDELGFDPARVPIIPNGHDPEPYRKHIDRQAIRATLQIAPNEKLLLYVGRLVDSKRVCDVIAAMPAIVSRGHPARLVIVGDGPERAALERQAESRSLERPVVFTGNRSDVVDLLLVADLFVFPSETEGLANSVIEACLASLPIAACAVPGVADIVRHGSEALLVPPRSPERLAEAVDNLLRNPEDAATLASAARQRALDHFSVDGFLSRLYDVYDTVLGERQME